MGGSLAVTIREADGTEHRMCRWTNPTPYFVNNPLLCEKDPAYLAGYLSQWRDMREDFERNQGNKAFEHNMTSCYAPYPFLAPHGYGLLVVDMQRDVILDMQGYTSYGAVDVTGIRLELTELRQRASGRGVSLHVGAMEPDSKLASLRGFAERGRVACIKIHGHEERVIDAKGQDFESIKSLISGVDRRDHAEVVYDMSPFKVEWFRETVADARRLRERVLELGFRLSDEEEGIWSEWFSERE